MPVRLIAAAAAGAVLTLASVPLRAASSMSAEQGWTAVTQCAADPSERARHACVDEVLRRAGLLTPQAEAKQRRQQFGLDENTARTAPPAPAPAAKASPAAPSDDRVDVELTTAILA